MQQSGSGIDVQRRADDHQDVGLLHLFGCHGNIGHGLAEEDDKRSEQRAVASLCAGLHLAVVGCQRYLITRVVDIAAGAHLHQFSMQVNHPCRARLFMQVVYVLRHYGHVIVLLKGSHQAVALVGFHAPALAPQHIIEVRYQRRIGLPSLVGGHLCHGVFLPQSVSIAERLQTTFHRHAGTCQHHQFLFPFHTLY